MPEALVISVNLADGISLTGSEAAGANWMASIQKTAKWDRLVIGILLWAGKDSKAWSKLTTGTACFDRAQQGQFMNARNRLAGRRKPLKRVIDTQATPHTPMNQHLRGTGQHIFLYFRQPFPGLIGGRAQQLVSVFFPVA